MKQTTDLRQDALNKVTIKRGSVSIRKRERFSDPRALQIDLDTDYVITKDHPDKSIHSDRVMPLKNQSRFFSILKRKTKTFKGADISHFWVSGYIALYFYMKCKDDSRKIKKIVQDAYMESGGSMSFDDWYAEHNKKHMRIMQFSGTGSGITKTFDNIHSSVAFL